MSGYQACATAAAHLLITATLQALVAFAGPEGPGFSIDAAQRAHLAIIAAIGCGAPLLLLLLTPKATPTRAGGKAGTTAEGQEGQAAPPVAAPTDAQACADTLAPAPTTNPAGAGTGTSAARAAVSVAPAEYDDDQPPYRSRLLGRSVTFTVKFPSLHLADLPLAATPEGREAQRACVERTLSEKASLLAGAPVTLRCVTLLMGAGCVVVHGEVVADDDSERGDGGGRGEGMAATLLRGMGASDVATQLLPEGARMFDGDAAVLLLGNGAPATELAFSAAEGRFVEAPPRSAPALADVPGMLLLSATWPLLALPRGGSSRVHLQFGLGLLAHALGYDPELVVSWVPSDLNGNATAPTPLVRASVAMLQAAARARGNPPGLVDIDVDLGPRPSHGVFIVQLIDGDALLAAHSVALLPASAQAIVAELLRARLPADTLHDVAHDLGVLLCGPRTRAPGDAAVLHSVALDLMAWESTCRSALPALRALLDELDVSLHELDAGGAEQVAPNCSSPGGGPAVDVAVARPPSQPRASRPLLLWCWACIILLAVKAVRFLAEGLRAGALAVLFHALPYALAALPTASARLSARLPHALRSVDSCAARRVYTAVLTLLTMTTTAHFPASAVFLSCGGDVPLLLAWAWLEPPRSPALSAAISLLAEVPAACMYRWHAFAFCGQAVSVGQAQLEAATRVALLSAVHIAAWWAGTRASRPTKLKVA
ncbi:hypothetical protein FOA52_004592 [Chlamydomonas sp. UWO 241]|nr:hypothetical protein FOA52_004592 [Chlamydomonas sp. UWO 241]